MWSHSVCWQLVCKRSSFFCKDVTSHLQNVLLVARPTLLLLQNSTKGWSSPRTAPCSLQEHLVKCFSLSILLSFFKLILAKSHWENAREDDKKEGLRGGGTQTTEAGCFLKKKKNLKISSLPNCSMSFTCSVDCIRGSSISFVDKLIKINLAWILCPFFTVPDNCFLSKWLTPFKAKPWEFSSLHPRETFFRDENRELILHQSSLCYNFTWKVTSVHQNKSKKFEAILSSPRNIGGFQICQAEPGSDDGRLQTH